MNPLIVVSCVFAMPFFFRIISMYGQIFRDEYFFRKKGEAPPFSWVYNIDYLSPSPLLFWSFIITAAELISGDCKSLPWYLQLYFTLPLCVLIEISFYGLIRILRMTRSKEKKPAVDDQPE